MAVHISRVLLQSASTSSSAPFLYQTRTLAPLSRILHRPITHELRHQYSTDYNISDGRGNSSQNRSAGRDTDTETATSDPASSNARTPRRSFLRRRVGSTAPPKIESGKPSSPSKPLKTMTHHEKLIFADLLGQINIKKGGHAEMTEAKRWQKPREPKPGRGKPDNINELISMFDSILDDAQKKEEQKKKKKSVSGSGARAQGELGPEATGPSSDIPAESDQIRLSDLGLSKRKSGRDEGAMVTVAEAVELVVKREAKKIEAELFRAIEEDRGDMGLWEVCKEHIFTILQHLDESPATPEATPEATPDTATPNQLYRHPKEASATLEATPDTAAPNQLDTSAPIEPSSSARPPGRFDIPDLVPASPVVARLYPKTLLVAFRLLNTHFPDSQLISQFRSTIKAQGRTSAVLGTSGALYDEMIYFYWYGCNDLPAVVSFLHDMYLHGLTPSFKSRQLLKDIVRQRYQKLRAARKAGEETDSFWDLPPNRKAFLELAGPGGWLKRLDEYAKEQGRLGLDGRVL